MEEVSNLLRFCVLFSPWAAGNEVRIGRLLDVPDKYRNKKQPLLGGVNSTRIVFN